MAGYRRTRAVKTATKTGKPVMEVRRATQAEQQRARRRASLEARLRAATTPGDQLAAACDYLRGAIRRADPVTADRIARQVVRSLVSHGDRLLGGK
uniref:hypothetical protein n=1 Tax=Actinokineospora sp. CA-119265 TaxID=3239890 RepID=UPI003F498DC4